MKQILLATTAILSLGATAFAADLPARRAPPPYVAVPVFTWTGFYIGVNAGYAFSDGGDIATVGNNGAIGVVSTINNVFTGARPAASKIEPDGFSGGGQIGYNYQAGMFVWGIEADIAYTDLKESVDVVGTTGAISRFSTELNYLGTVRGRLGIAFDRLLVYGTGGFAYGDVESSGTFFATPAAGGLGVIQFAGVRSDIRTGYVAGGGIEYALPANYSLFNSNAVTIKAEALYYDLEKTNVVVADTGLAPVATRGQSYTSRFETSGVIVRGGINLKFGTY